MKTYVKKYLKRFAAVMMVALCLVLGSSLMPGGSAQAAAKKTTLEKKVESIVKAKVKTGSSKQAALKTLFQYVEKTYNYKRVVGFKDTAGWEKTYALSMIKSKAGSCYHFAALYAFLTKKATGFPVRLCIGTTNGFNKARWQAHAWVEIKISGKWYIFDPNMDKFAAKSKLKYYKKNRDSLYNKTYKVQKRIAVAF
ncbi:MAG: transglutaminase-like domain-containing protein [Candidatus Limivivens sp.]|nr:transglutaminase-like domain-containing protein [Candidatus Limivivens sp.]